jgi:AcrR family transcriptional regulator
MKAAREGYVGTLSRADVRKQKLLDASRRLFIDNGFHATGVAQIAKDSGIAVGQIYRDFSSKEEIVAALVEADCSEFLQIEALQKAIRTRDTDEVLAWLLRFVEGEDDLDASRLFVEVVAESSRNPRIAAVFAGLQQSLRAHLSSAIEMLASSSGSSERSHLLADVIMTMSLGILQHRVMMPGSEVKTIAKALQAIITDRLAAVQAGN